MRSISRIFLGGCLAAAVWATPVVAEEGNKAAAKSCCPAMKASAKACCGKADCQKADCQKADFGVGCPAPSFGALDDTGAKWRSADYVGKKVLVVYFYPAAMTGGCTKQACAYRDDRQALADLGAEVVGVSGDTVEGQAIFKRAHNLNFTLLADPDGAVAKQFGVPVTEGSKTLTREVGGKEVALTRGATARRWTFVIDKTGKIAYKNTEVNAVQDSQEVLAVVRKLIAG